MPQESIKDLHKVAAKSKPILNAKKKEAKPKKGKAQSMEQQANDVLAEGEARAWSTRR